MVQGADQLDASLPDTFTAEYDTKLSQKVREALETMPPDGIRMVVDLYYQLQENRKRAGNQTRAAFADTEPHLFVAWLMGNMGRLERSIVKAMDIVSGNTLAGRWAKSQVGIGPILTAGLLAHIDIRRAPTPSHLWSFAGLNPQAQWLGDVKAGALITKTLGNKRQYTMDEVQALCNQIHRNTVSVLRMIRHKEEEKATKANRPYDGRITTASLRSTLALRPWNAQLKTLAWKCGDSFVKFHNRPKCVYGALYAERKAQEVSRDTAGQYAEVAKETLATRTFKDSETRRQYEAGHLPAGRLDLRARRYAVKIFLAHLHHVLYVGHYHRDPPLPYILENDPRHTHYIPIPNWPMGEEV